MHRFRRLSAKYCPKLSSADGWLISPRAPTSYRFGRVWLVHRGKGGEWGETSFYSLSNNSVGDLCKLALKRLRERGEPDGLSWTDEGYTFKDYVPEGQHADQEGWGVIPLLQCRTREVTDGRPRRGRKRRKT